MSDAALLTRPQTDRAFERLYTRHVHDVYRYVLAVLRNPADAEDVTQATFLNAFRAFQRGDRPELARNWLLKIAHNECRQRFRMLSRRQGGRLGRARRGTAHRRGVPTADEIRQALGHLSFNQRSALVMRELEGRSYGEIGEILDLSVSAVETLIFRARRALREQLEGGLSCGEAEATLSKRLDGTLAPSEQRALRAHLRECSECATLERKQRAQRARKRLGVVQLPPSLAGFVGGGAGSTVGGSSPAPASGRRRPRWWRPACSRAESATRRSRRSRPRPNHRAAAAQGRCRAPSRTSTHSTAAIRNSKQADPGHGRVLGPVDALPFEPLSARRSPGRAQELDAAAVRRNRRAGRRSAGGRDHCSGGECDAAGPRRRGDGEDRRQGVTKAPLPPRLPSRSRRRRRLLSRPCRRCRRSRLACSAAAPAAAPPPPLRGSGAESAPAQPRADSPRPMGIVNRRNAVLGWATWQVGKAAAKQKRSNR